MQAISKGLEKVIQELSTAENDGPISIKFCKVFNFIAWNAEYDSNLTSPSLCKTVQLKWSFHFLQLGSCDIKVVILIIVKKYLGDDLLVSFHFLEYTILLVICGSFSPVLQNLKEFLRYAEAEVRSLASMYSAVVGCVLLALYVIWQVRQFFTWCSLFYRVETWTHWLSTSEKIQLDAPLNKVFSQPRLVLDLLQISIVSFSNFIFSNGRFFSYILDSFPKFNRS